MCGPTSDIITHLPDNVKETILMSLPLQDAVRTSILSRKWGYMWARLPQLLFDDKFCRELIRNQKNKLMMTIYQVLLLHREPIPKFILNLSRLESCPEINQLILFLSNNGITEAETSKLVTLFGSLPVIEFLLLEYHTIRYMSAGGVPKRLPTTLNNLKTLKLLSICFAEVNEISVILCLIRSSPNLEKITIVVRRCEIADVIDHVLQLLEMQDWSDVSLNQLQAVELGNLSGT
ncbi:F-box/FBD/LRR-repeat protein At1g13570-like [Camellia sinensis]|nr:F-box/FBD/LRR-repeat protein At1g13570-like [Camellia sinensis]